LPTKKWGRKKVAIFLAPVGEENKTRETEKETPCDLGTEKRTSEKKKETSTDILK